MEFDHTPLPIVDYAIRVEPRNRDATGLDVFEEGDLLVRSVELSEDMDGLYDLEVTVLANAVLVEVPPEALLEADVTLRITRGDHERQVHGIVARVDFAGVQDESVWVRLSVGPAVGLLDRWNRSRIFQDQSVVDIVATIVRENLGTYDREVDASLLVREHQVRDYCVQYRETDLAFVRRILAEEGIFMLFDHGDEAREKAVLIDSPSAFAPISCELLQQGKEQQEPPLVPVIADRPETADSEGVIAFEGLRTVATRSVEVRGWNWKSQPLDWPGASETLESELPGFIGEAYHHGDRRLIEEERGDGPHRDETPVLAKRRLAGLAAKGTRSSGRSLVVGFEAGHTFTIDGHPHQTIDDRTYVITQVRHRGDCPQVERGAEPAGGLSNYSNWFACAPLEMRQLPKERRKPRIFGYQSALVVGPPGHEIHTDELGRIKVLMHWDREQRDAAPESSCWLRVAQMVAGPKWGTFFLPRVGMEVLVAFMDGDPDRPIVTGCVYNSTNMPPYTAAEATKSTIKTSTSPGGEGYNELRFEDAKGSEEVFIHAQRNMNTRVRVNESTNVGNDQSNTVGNNQTVTVKKDRTVVVEGDEDQTVKKNRTRKVDGEETVTISGSQSISVNASKVPKPGGVQVDVHGTYEISVRDHLIIKLGETSSIVITPIGMTFKVPGVEFSLGPAGATLQALMSKLTLGPMALLESETRVRHQCGTSHVTLDPMAVRASALTAVVDGKSMTTIKSAGPLTVNGTHVVVDGTATLAMSSLGTITASCAGSTQSFAAGMIDLA